MENDLFLIIFSQLDSFLRIFGKVKELLILELHEMIKALHPVACPMNFNLICDRGQQGRTLKPIKNDHLLVVLAFWVFCPSFQPG